MTYTAGQAHQVTARARIDFEEDPETGFQHSRCDQLLDFAFRAVQVAAESGAEEVLVRVMSLRREVGFQTPEWATKTARVVKEGLEEAGFMVSLWPREHPPALSAARLFTLDVKISW